MKQNLCHIWVLLAFLLSCKEDDVRLFDKTADERIAEAIANLRQELLAPTNGWLIKYRPQQDAGTYYVLMKFLENDKVVIETDLGAENGAYVRDTISYRIDSSMGLELILETYSFFSFLFELDQATFEAEYEFDYVNKTPDDALVFRSKTDSGIPGIILFRPASPDDRDLLGVTLASNLDLLAQDLDKFTSSLRMTYTDEDLVLYLALDDLKRTVTITAASLKSNTATTQSVNFSTGYLIERDKIVFDEPFQGTILGTGVSIESVQLGAVSESTLNVCAEPIPIHGISGVTSAGDDIFLETSLVDVGGRSFAQLSDFYVAPIGNVFSNDTSAAAQIRRDIEGATAVQLYYGFDLEDGEPFYAIGFLILNSNGSASFALKEFTPTLIDNNIVFNFTGDVTLFGADTDADIEKANIYLDALTEGDKTYVFELVENVYEFYNPCSRWSFVFINVNQ